MRRPHLEVQPVKSNFAVIKGLIIFKGLFICSASKMVVSHRKYKYTQLSEIT